MRVNESFSLTYSGFNTNMNTNYASGQEMAELSPMNVELKSLDATLEIVESTLANAGILHIGGLGAVSLAVMLGTISSIALLIRGTFVYYLTNYAPKGRAINRLMFLDQVRFYYDFLGDGDHGVLGLVWVHIYIMFFLNMVYLARTV